ncbi:MAG: glycosyltransferase [Deltaproteobacteria bacterium]|nr:glycosyltransferase [Deltaproteobacteria bacterium]
MTQEKIIVATSIPPMDIEVHRLSVDTWFDAGLDVISINTREEISQLADSFPKVRFLETSRTGKALFQKPLVFIDDLLSALYATDARLCGIVNADIHFTPGIPLAAYMCAQPPKSFLFGSRSDVDNLEDEAREQFFKGRDYFFFERSSIPEFLGAGFCLGAPWWDVWFPLAAMGAGIQPRQIRENIAKHVIHGTRWDQHQVWDRCAQLFMQYMERSQHPICSAPGYEGRRTDMINLGKNPQFADFVTDYLESITDWVSLKEWSERRPRTDTPVPHAPAVSAIVSTFNSELFMRGCLEDLLNQTLFTQGKLEIVVVDSASSQKEGDIVRDFQARYLNIRYIRTSERESIYQAWNRGIRAASGRYITNANSDDRHRYDALEVMAACLDAESEVALVYGDVFVTNFPNQSFDRHLRCGYHLRPEFEPEIMLSGCHMGPQPLWRRSLHDEIGYFSEEFISAGDYEFWCRIAQSYRIKHIPQFLGLYYENPQGFANSDTGLSRRETLKIQQMYAASFPPPTRNYSTNFQYLGAVDELSYVNICMIAKGNLLALQENLEALIRCTEYPHVITVVAMGGCDGTCSKFLQAAKRIGLITNLEPLDTTEIEMAKSHAMSCEPNARHHVFIDAVSRPLRPGWLTDYVLDAGKQETGIKGPDVDACGNKTVLFVMYGWRETGGGTTFPRAVARELARRGYRVAVVYASLESDPSQPACALRVHEEEGIRLFGIINRPAIFTDPDHPQREIDNPDVRRAFCRVLDQVKPGIVHFHNFHGLSFSLAEETHSRNIPTCFTPHNYHLIDPELYLLKNGLISWDSVDPMTESDAVRRNPKSEGWYRKRIETTQRLMNQWVGITLAVSQRQRELLIRYGGDPKRIAVIHQISPAADALWQNPVVATARERSMRLPLQVGYIGGLIPIKGVQMLVAAAQAFAPDQLQVHLYGFGVSDYEQDLRTADRKGIVTFHGAYSHEELPHLAQQIDLAVIPSLVEESAPTLVLSELFAMGVPVVAANIGGIPEFITEGTDGVLYPPCDLEALIGHLKTFVNKPELLAAMRHNLTAPTHTFERYMEQLVMLYREMMSGTQLDAGRISLIAAKRSAVTAISPQTLRISWHGGLFVHHSLALVNRELCLQLLERGFDISFSPSQPDEFPPSIDPRFSRLEACRHRPLAHADVTVRHQWPPDFSPLPQGKLVVIQPWEFGSIPTSWVAQINENVDELWVPSTFVRDCYLQSGVDAGKVQVVPNGVATGRFHPEVPPLTLATNKQFRFLFVGGTIHRKGIDLLLAAYSAAFSADDDVCLVIKDMGGNSIYQGQTAGEMIASFQRVAAHPEVLYLEDMLDTDRMAALYTACHCLVHPYRGEGFGLPIAEAMACGLAPVVTGYGAALDFCPPEIAWLIPAVVMPLATRQVGNLETVGFPWLAEPDCDALSSLLRQVFDYPDEVGRRGTAACHFIRERFTWGHAARIAETRLRFLGRQSGGSGKADAVTSVPLPPQGVQSGNTAATTDNGMEGDVTMNNQLVQAACCKAELLAQRGDVDSAVEVLLTQGIPADVTSPVPYLALVEILMTADRYQEALGVASEMPAGTDKRVIREIEAQCYCALGDDIAAGEAATLAGAERPRALVVLGTLAARQGDSTQGELLFRQAIAVDANCGKAWLSLGMILWGQGRQQDAWQAVRRAVEIDPLNDPAVKIFRDISKRLA